MHPEDDIPQAPRLHIERPSLLRGVAALLGTLAVMWFAVALYRWATEPIVITSSSTAAAPSAARSPVSIPPELVQMAVAISTSLAPPPTPIPPTPTYALPPTPKPPDVCLTSTPRGAVCTQPKPPLPSPTPMADCPVLPGELCVNDGGPVTWLSTPTPDEGY